MGDVTQLPVGSTEEIELTLDELAREGARRKADAAALAAIEQPALLVAATDSLPLLREATDALADVLPNARSSLVGGGHLIDPASPEVIAFIEEVLEGR